MVLSESDKKCLFDTIMKDISRGLPMIWALEAAAVSDSTFYAWMKARPEWRETYEKAKGDFRRSLIKTLLDVPDAKYVTWYMERIAPAQFGRAKAHENRATFTEATAMILMDADCAIIDKYHAVIGDFVGQHITLEIFKMMIDCLNTVCAASELPEILAMQEKIKTMLENQA